MGRAALTIRGESLYTYYNSQLYSISLKGLNSGCLLIWVKMPDKYGVAQTNLEVLHVNSNATSQRCFAAIIRKLLHLSH